MKKANNEDIKYMKNDYPFENRFIEAVPGPVLLLSVPVIFLSLYLFFSPKTISMLLVGIIYLFVVPISIYRNIKKITKSTIPESIGLSESFITFNDQDRTFDINDIKIEWAWFGGKIVVKNNINHIYLIGLSLRSWIEWKIER